MMNNYITKIKKVLQDFLKDPLFLKRWEMPYYSQNREDNQLSVRAVYSSGRRYHYNGDGNNFVQNIYTGIMPFSHMVGQREKYPVKIEPASPQKERLIASGISNRSYPMFLAEALYDFVRTTSHSLFMYGITFFEVVYEKDATVNTTSFHFEYLDEKYLFKLFGNYYQIIPWWIAKQSGKYPIFQTLFLDFRSKKLDGFRGLQEQPVFVL